MAETRKNANESMHEAADAGRETAEAVAGAMQEAAVMGLDGVRRVTEQVTQTLGVAGQDTEALARQASENLGALAETGTVLARGVQDVSREWLRLSQHGLQKNIEGLTQLVHCRSIPDFVAVQSELMRNNVHYIIDVSRQLAERSIEVANEATQKISAEAKQATGRARKAA